MSIGWQLYRIICILQMVLATIILMTTLFRSFQNPSFTIVIRLLVFLPVILLAIFALHTLNNNYPATPVTGSQKSTFNRLFLLNFVFLAFLFGFLISAARSVDEISIWRSSGRSFRSSAFINFIAYGITLLFQVIVLLGLYNLRRLLYVNFRRQEFEFEEKNK